ncbi:MAG: aquaporin [Rhodospirillaceae bacterium]|nr:aquaporin [Rhodospirillaceae bacterium]
MALRAHWPEYLIEAAGLGLFMVSAGVFATLLWAPGSPLEGLVADGVPRRALMGVLMGLTAVLIIYSPFGQRSGAHLNPALTLTFWWLGKIASADALFYVLAQTIGGTLGVLAVLLALGPAFADPPVTYVATQVGPHGAIAALAAETAIAFVLMLTVLAVGNSRRFMRATGLCAGLLLVVFITVEAPYSGMSLNPARSLASALPAMLFDRFWVYVAGPLGGMLAAAALWRFVLAAPVTCCKLDHPLHIRCIFRCGYCQHQPDPPQS